MNGEKTLKRKIPRTLEYEIGLRGSRRKKPLRGPQETLKVERTKGGTLGKTT